MSLVLVGLMAVATPAVATASTSRPAGAKKISSTRVRHVGHIVCARFTSKRQWVPGTLLKKGYFIAHETQAKNYAKLAREAKGKKRKKLNATAARYRRLAKGQRSRCYFPAPTYTPPTSNGWTPPAGWTPPPATPLRFNISGSVGLALGNSAGARAMSASSTATAASTGTNLVAVNTTGSTRDAIGSGSAAISRFLIAPNNQVYVVFSTPVDLNNSSSLVWGTGTRCLIAVVNPASGVPTCVDSQLGWISSWSQEGSNPLIQFDGAGAIYYTGYTTTGNTVLRRYLNGVATDLINDNISVNDFLVRPDGSVFITGRSSTGATWTRRISPSGGLQNIRLTNSSFMRAFPDGNVYMGFSDPPAVRRYLTASNALDPKSWIGNTGDPNMEYFTASTYCPSVWNAFCGGGSYIKGTYQTADGKVFAVAGSGADGVLMQYYPNVDAPATAVTKVSVAQSVNNSLLLAGRNDQDQNVLTLYNTSTRTERQLLGPENEIEIYHLNYVASANKVLFDGLRFADNKYVLGQIDLSTNAVTVTATTAGKWADFQTFG